MPRQAHPACPDCCTLHPGHAWDFIDTTGPFTSRVTPGPAFGDITIGSREYQDGTVVDYGNNIVVEIDATKRSEGPRRRRGPDRRCRVGWRPTRRLTS